MNIHSGTSYKHGGNSMDVMNDKLFSLREDEDRIDTQKDGQQNKKWSSHYSLNDVTENVLIL